MVVGEGGGGATLTLTPTLTLTVWAGPVLWMLWLAKRGCRVKGLWMLWLAKRGCRVKGAVLRLSWVLRFGNALHP